MRSHSTRIWTQNTTRQLIFLILLRNPFSLRYDWTITVDVHFFRVYIVVAFAHSPGSSLVGSSSVGNLAAVAHQTLHGNYECRSESASRTLIATNAITTKAI